MDRRGRGWHQAGQSETGEFTAMMRTYSHHSTVVRYSTGGPALIVIVYALENSELVRQLLTASSESPSLHFLCFITVGYYCTLALYQIILSSPSA